MLTSNISYIIGTCPFHHGFFFVLIFFKKPYLRIYFYKLQNNASLKTKINPKNVLEWREVSRKGLT